MFVLGNFFQALAGVVDMLLTTVYVILLVRVLLSWVNPDPYNPIVQFLYGVTEPILRPLRSVIPPVSGFDLSPILAFIALMFIKSFLVSTLFEIGSRLR